MAALDMRGEHHVSKTPDGGKNTPRRRSFGPPRCKSQAPGVKNPFKKKKGSPVPLRRAGWRGGARSRRGGVKALHAGPQLARSASPGPLLGSQVPVGQTAVRRCGRRSPRPPPDPEPWTHLRGSCWTSACAASLAPSSLWG